MISRFSFRLRALVCALLVPVVFLSCTGHIGYGVMNWSVPESSLTAGDIVPVFIQSNIGKVYVIGAGKKRIEVPLWQLTLYKSKSKAKKAASALSEYRYAYASVKIDGLPMRATPENTARQVYRLKEGQKIKILKKGEGAPVLAGNSPLKGDWLEVMADDGTTGWCFSYNLTVFDERSAPAQGVAKNSSGPDSDRDNLLSRAWYPDSYRTMIESNQVDLDRVNPSWGFFPGNDSGVARVENADGVLTFPYTSIDKTADGAYAFTGSTLVVQVRRSDAIVAQYTDKAGKPQALYFASLDTTPSDIISAEQDRRDELLSRVRKVGPRFSSTSYGALQFLPDGKFLWSGWQLLSPSVIPSGAAGGGTVAIRCFLSPSLNAAYDGALTFTFDQSPARINFLYSLTPKGLKLEFVSESNIKDSVVQAQNLNPTVVFFTPDKGDN